MDLEPNVRIKKISYEKKEDVLSEFRCRELFYEYTFDLLTQERKKAVEKALARSTKLASEYEVFLKGLSFCQDVRQTQVANELIQKFLSRESFAKVLLKKVSVKVPDSVKVFVQAASIATVTAFIMSFIPWDDISFEYDLFKQEPVELANLSFTQNPDESFTAALVSQKDEEKSTEQLPKKDEFKVDVKAEKVVAKIKHEKLKQKALPLPIVKKEAKPVKVKKAAVVAKATSTKKSKTKGYFYSGTIVLRDINAKARQIEKIIRSLGGKKAGKFKLGANFRGGKYFHFSMEKSKYRKLLARLDELGKVKLLKKPSSRIMSEGFERYAIWLGKKK